MSDVVTAPDERALRAHLAGGRFQAGVEALAWRLISLAWPIAIVGIWAATRDGAPSEFAIRFELNGYPNVTPTGGIWDPDTNTSLAPERRPKGERAAMLFRADGWAGGALAMYAPWDRIALQTHVNWAQEAPRLVWHAQRDLTFILENVHEVLNADDYLGI